MAEEERGYDMIELRWLVRTIFINDELGNKKVFGKQEIVLQYRTMSNPIEVFLQEPIWSEWEDVETVDESQQGG